MYRVKRNFLPAYRGHEQPLHVEASNGWQPLVLSNPASNERTENKAQVEDRGYENKTALPLPISEIPIRKSIRMCDPLDRIELLTEFTF